jgi:hypothetical protein
MKYDVATRSVLMGMLCLFATASVIVDPMDAPFMAKGAKAGKRRPWGRARRFTNRPMISTLSRRMRVTPNRRSFWYFL